MLDLAYDYTACVRASEKASWRLDDVMPENTRLDFDKPFLPEALAPTNLAFLSIDERRVLNQISGNAYLNLFQFVEEFILATMLTHAQGAMYGNPDEVRALTRFVDEELKHQQLFHRYREAFERDFGHKAGVLENAVEVAGIIMGHSPIGVLVITLHIELMTQQHYVASVKDSTGLDPFFVSLLKFHWMEESQHARIDALELNKLVTENPDGAEKGVVEYLGILSAMDGLLKAQSELDVTSLAAATGRSFSDDERRQIQQLQHAGYRSTFIISGLTNATFVGHMRRMAPEGAALMEQRANELALPV